MQRPLTAADRVPQVGDVLYGESGVPLTVGAVLSGNASEGYKVVKPYDRRERWFTVAPWWRYRHRADQGSITTEAP